METAACVQREPMWPSFTPAPLCTNSLKALQVVRMKCMTEPAGAPAQHINRNISVMEDQHKVKLITQTAKMKHKNQLCLALSLCPQRLFSHPQLTIFSYLP